MFNFFFFFLRFLFLSVSRVYVSSGNSGSFRVASAWQDERFHWFTASSAPLYIVLILRWCLYQVRPYPFVKTHVLFLNGRQSHLFHPGSTDRSLWLPWRVSFESQMMSRPSLSSRYTDGRSGVNRKMNGCESLEWEPHSNVVRDAYATMSDLCLTSDAK